MKRGVERIDVHALFSATTNLQLASSTMRALATPIPRRAPDKFD
jgi:hypothetical protein